MIHYSRGLVIDMKIAIDLDNIIINTTETLVDYINERLPVDLKMSDITTYSIESALPEQYRWVVDAGFHDKNFWKEVKVIPEAIEVIEQIYNEGNSIWFATSSLPENLRKKINHLSRNLPFLPKDFVWRHTINLQDKSLLDVDVLIDDCLGHLLHPDRKYVGIVLDYPWNQTESNIPNLLRAYSWWGIYDRIKTIETFIKENENE